MLGVLGFPNDGDVRCLEDNWHCLKLWLVGVGVWCPHHTVFSQIVLQLERVSSFMDFHKGSRTGFLRRIPVPRRRHPVTGAAKGAKDAAENVLA